MTGIELGIVVALGAPAFVLATLQLADRFLKRR